MVNTSLRFMSIKGRRTGLIRTVKGDELMFENGNRGDKQLEEVCTLFQIHLLPLGQVTEH